VRKLGVPGQEELAFGAICSGGARVVNDEIVRAVGLDSATIEAVTAAEERELARREDLYRRGLPSLAVAGRTVALIDDGLATGSTMLAAVRALKTQAPTQMLVAVPVAPASTLAALSTEVDRVVCVHAPRVFWSVGEWYEDFPQTSDAEVLQLLGAFRQ
jgi:predicted phosphoribosyltransferase